jgi:hypothetical protein
VQKQEEETDLFFHSLKSKETRIKYSSYLKKYLEITGIENPLSERDPRLIERQIIDFIIKMKREDKNWGAIHNYVAMILSFYKINDVILNTTKISRFMPEQRKVKTKKRPIIKDDIIFTFLKMQDGLCCHQVLKTSEKGLMMFVV